MEQKIVQFLKQPAIFRSLYFVFCMIISFGLGIMTHYTLQNQGNEPILEIPSKPTPLALRYKTPTMQNPYDLVPAIESASTTPSVSSTEPNQSIVAQNNFVASKTGTKYYPAGCGGISRIKEENRVYFATEKEAQEKGYSRTETCK